jgi:hypothetical protein
MKPEEAGEAARAGAAEQRAQGAYSEDLRAIELEPGDERVTSDQLMEWALIEPDAELVVSTRRWGAPISWFKRVLLHVLRQYLAQVESQQTRFNVHLLARVVEQEERLSVMEEWLREDSPDETPFRPAGP